MRSITTFALLAFAAAVSTPAFADDVAPTSAEKTGAEWFTDFDKAVDAAKGQKKDLLLDFTGSGWCGWCTRLHDEVFSQPEFAAEAPKSYVLVKLDYTAGGEPQNSPNPARGKELAAKFAIEGFPTILVLSADGDVIGRTGYEKGGAKSWMAHLESVCAAGREVLSSAAKLDADYAAAADATARTAVVTTAVERLEKAAEAGSPSARLAAVARHAVELDPENKAGLELRAMKALFAAGQDRADDMATAQKLDPKNESGLLELVLAGQFKALRSMLTSEEAVAAHKADIDAFVAAGRALAATGNLKNPDVYVPALANACGIAKRLQHDDAAAREIANVLKEKGPADDTRLAAFLKTILDDKAPSSDGK